MLHAGCKEVPAKVLQRIADNLPYVTELNLQGCTKLTNDVLSLIVERLPNLKKLDVSDCVRLKEKVQFFLLM